MSEEWPDDDARFTGPGCPLDKIGVIASGRAFKPEAPRPRLAPVGRRSKVTSLVDELGGIRDGLEELKAKWIDSECVDDPEELPLELGDKLPPMIEKLDALIGLVRTSGRS